MTVYGASPTRDRPGWFFGLTGPQLASWSLSASPAGSRWRSDGGAPAPPGARSAICAALDLRPGPWLVGHPVDRCPRPAPDRRSMAGQASSRRPPRARSTPTTSTEADLPGVLAGIQIHDGPPMPGRSTRPAVIQNHATRTWAATARSRPPRHRDGRRPHPHRMGAALADLLEAAAAGGQIDLLAIQVRTVPDDGTERADWVRRHRRPRSQRSRLRSTHDLDAMPAGPQSAPKPSSPWSSARTPSAKTPDEPGAACTGRARSPVRHPPRSRGPSDRRHRLHPRHLARHRGARHRDPHRLRTRRRRALADAAIRPRTIPRSERASPSPPLAPPTPRPLALLPPRGLGVGRRHDPAATQGRPARGHSPEPSSRPSPVNAAP